MSQRIYHNFCIIWQ